jgi:protein-tyrosine sulfotransferase
VTPPLFILSQARTGSTLVRYLVDAHPDVCCPPELALGRLCRSLAYTIDLTCRDRSEVHRRVRAHVDAIMSDYCLRKNKPRWCDKSTNNLEHLEMVDAVFPDAQYICLHRQCLDVVQSLMELFKYGFPGRYSTLVARSPERLVDGLIDSWTGPTRTLLAFEAAHHAQCVRLRYEDLVADPSATAERLFSFLGHSFDATMLDDMFSAPHDPGPGDFKIRFTTRILRSRVGKGSTIPQNQISADRVAAIDELHLALGYEPVPRQRPVASEQRLLAPRWG